MRATGHKRYSTPCRCLHPNPCARKSSLNPFHSAQALKLNGLPLQSHKLQSFQESLSLNPAILNMPNESPAVGLASLCFDPLNPTRELYDIIFISHRVNPFFSNVPRLNSQLLRIESWRSARRCGPVGPRALLTSSSPICAHACSKMLCEKTKCNPIFIEQHSHIR